MDRVSFDGEVFAGERLKTKMHQFVAYPGDIVVSKIRARQGSIGLVAAQQGQVSVTIHYRVLQPDAQMLDATYAWLALRSNYCRCQFLAATGGAMKGEISEEALLAIKLPLPPLDQQRLIVARWQAAQAEMAAASQRVEALKRATDKKLLAMLGLAVPERRDLPKCFAANWTYISRWSVPFNQQSLTAVSLDTGRFPTVPLGTLLTMLQYGTSEKANTTGKGVPVLRMNNIKDGQLDPTDIKHVPLTEREAQKLTVVEGDILFNRTNSKELVGKCAVFRLPGTFVFASYLIRVRLDITRAVPDYAAFFLNGPLGRQQIAAASRQIIGQANINSEEIRELLIPLPPLAIQRQLVERLTAARAEIARERVAAAKLATDTAAQIESLILGAAKL